MGVPVEAVVEVEWEIVEALVEVEWEITPATPRNNATASPTTERRMVRTRRRRICSRWAASELGRRGGDPPGSGRAEAVGGVIVYLIPVSRAQNCDEARMGRQRWKNLRGG